MTSPVLISERQADYRDTERSTEQTVQEMTRLIRDSLSDPEVQRVALAAISEGFDAPCDRRAIAAAVWLWLKRHVQFVTDEEQLLKLLGRRDELELLISPSVMVRTAVKRGDCDCFTMMACSMLQCLGVVPFIKTYKCDRQEPWRWAHVCAAALLDDGSVLPIDASHGDYPGWEVPAQDIYEFQLWDMGGNRVGAPMRKGLSGYVPQPGWTGSELSTASGYAAGPYAQRDFLRAYYPGPARLQGLQGIARGKYRGLGDCVDGFDENGDACITAVAVPTLPAQGTAPVIATSLPPLSTVNLPGAAYIDPTTGNYVDYSIASTPVGGNPSSVTSSGSFNLANFLSSLVAPAAALTSQALLPAGAQLLANGNYLLPNGTVVAPTPTASAISSSTLLMIGAAVLGVVLVSSLGKK